MEKYTNQLEDMVEDRTRQLAEEKKRTDELLYQILPRFAFPIQYNNNNIGIYRALYKEHSALQ